uniref:Putative secreted protein n=1 Tax=Anopheles darlingi TaxID=43151 RepID=A0A2M4D7W8_ANODA
MGLFLSLCWVVFIFLRSTPYPPSLTVLFPLSSSNQITKPIRTSTYLHTPGTRGVVFGGMMRMDGCVCAVWWRSIIMTIVQPSAPPPPRVPPVCSRDNQRPSTVAPLVPSRPAPRNKLNFRIQKRISAFRKLKMSHP